MFTLYFGESTRFTPSIIFTYVYMYFVQTASTPFVSVTLFMFSLVREVFRIEQQGSVKVFLQSIRSLPESRTPTACTVTCVCDHCLFELSLARGTTLHGSTPLGGVDADPRRRLEHKL